MKKTLTALALAGTLFSTGCAGVRHTNDTFSAHAESFRIFGFAIPHDDQAAARDQVPAGANITTVSSSAADWDSVVGFFGNLFGFHQTTISGTK